MNILYITHTSLGGGATTALINIVKEMVCKGHKAYIITDFQNGPLVDGIIAVGGSVITAPVSLTMYSNRGCILSSIYHTVKNFLGWLKTKRIIAGIIDSKSIDIVHTNVGPLNLALKICQRRGVPHIWHQREFFDMFSNTSFFPSNNYFLKAIKSKGNYNICITKQVAKHCKLNIDGVNNVVIYDGVFPSKEGEKIKSIIKKPYFLFVGRVEYNKGLHTMLNAFIRIKEKYPEYEIIIAGYYSEKNPYYKECLSIIKHNDIEHSVKFLGMRKDVYELMEHATAVVVPSLFEGFGFITVEAMLNNTLVIGRDSTGTQEQFDIGLEMTGSEIAYRFTNEDELSDAMEKAISRDNKDMIMNAKRVVCQHYSIELCTSRIEEFYKSVVKTTRKKYETI